MRLFKGLALVFGLFLLAIAISYRVCDRYFEESETGLQSVVGGIADVSGVTTLYMGITGRDLATERHRGLSDAQRHGMVTTGAIWILGLLLVLYLGVRAGLQVFRTRKSSDQPEGERPAKSTVRARGKP